MRSAIALFVVLLVSACGGEVKKSNPAPKPKDVAKAERKALIRQNKEAAAQESRDIDAYVSRKQLHAIRSGTGLRYTLVFDVPGEKAKPEDLVTVSYRAELLDGTFCYASERGKPETFRVEHDQVESGLHEGVQLMSAGDSAVFVIPSHLAFGLVGDMDKIPMRSSVVYHLKLLEVNGKSAW